MGVSRDGGKPNVGDVNNYREPVGPKRNYPAAPGLAGGDNYGCCGTQGKGSVGASESGGPGIIRQGGESRGYGTQGKR
jgi:hypothetical protein